MVFPAAVNDQITDAVTRSNVEVAGKAPAIALGSAYQAVAHATDVLFQNAVAAQQQQNALARAQGVMEVDGMDTRAAAGAGGKMAQTGVAGDLTSLLTVLQAFK
ncbi:RebB family R body protein [Xanthomonas sp. NCPPB 3582]|uniref:RebB family R body protein n=1 Tax=Xanthomonas sp. NCPPB 3582 TaxID=487557 RepID=UPI0035585D33